MTGYSFFNESIVDDHNTYIFVIEWANNGSLRNYLNLNFSSMTGNDKIRFATEITKGVMCLHQKGILHRDLVINAIYVFLNVFENSIDYYPNIFRIVATSWFTTAK